MSKICSKCDAVNIEKANFCGKCGSSTFKNNIKNDQEKINQVKEQMRKDMYKENTARYLKLKEQREIEAKRKASQLGKIFNFIKNIFKK